MKNPPNLKKHLVRSSFIELPFPNGEDEENRIVINTNMGGEVEDAYSLIH